jgi:uncharacterized protein involved in exopolysaccharide biosynthesis
MTEARIKENQARKLDFIQVLGQARIPDTPEPQIKVTILALGIALSTALGIMLAFVWEYLARHRPQRATAPPVARQFT